MRKKLRLGLSISKFITLNWIVDTYADVSEIAIRGQRIIYMVHPQVGHLGIFVSSKVAQREHTEVASTMQVIEALAPGLYEMKIEDYQGDVLKRTFTISFHERTLDDIRALDDGREDEIPFAAVARASELQADLYDVFVRPFVQAGVNAASAEMSRALHPLRLQRALASSRNPMVRPLAKIAEHLTKNEARLETGRNIDVKNIRSPIIVFTSHGDNITPPQQAAPEQWCTLADNAKKDRARARKAQGRAGVVSASCSSSTLSTPSASDGRHSATTSDA